jgi:hypothetical protein
MTWVGGVAALITLVVLSIASARLNSIMRMIGEENSQLNFQRLAANEGVCSTLEGSLADSSIDKAFGLLSQLNAKDDEREIFKDLAVAMKSVDAENGGALMAKLPAPGSTTRLRVVSQSRNRLSDRHLEDFKMPPSLRADAISETPSPHPVLRPFSRNGRRALRRPPDPSQDRSPFALRPEIESRIPAIRLAPGGAFTFRPLPAFRGARHLRAFRREGLPPAFDA